MTGRRGALALLVMVGLAATACLPVKEPPPPPLSLPCSASSGSPASDNDPLRTGWYPDQPGLNPSAGGQCGFGQVWSSPVDGQVYAAPLVDPGVGANGTLLVATETNHVYGLDAVTGVQLWEPLDLGPPWNASDIGCTDLSPTVGITSTPAIDPATHTAYLFSKTYDPPGPDPPPAAAWFAHAVDLTDGHERTDLGFPKKIEGPAANDLSVSFDPKMHLQRPGLLLMDGVVYAAFGGQCDLPDYRGWVVGVNATTGAMTTRWTDEALTVGNNSPGGGIWQTGGRLVSDKPGEILLAAGNGAISPGGTALPGTTPPLTLGESAIRLKVQLDGSLQAKDFFSPCNAQALSDGDLDIGSGAPLVLPADPFGSSPRLAVVVGKEGTIYLLDRDNLGGYRQGSGSSCPDGSGTDDKVVNKFMLPDTPGVFATPAVWPGDGGFIYFPYPTFFGAPNAGKLTTYQIVNSGGQPTLSLAGLSDDAFGFGSSSAVITSDGTTSGSALVWVVWMPNGSGNGAELRAYDPNPVGGALQLRGSWPIGQGTKFNTPTVHAGRIYVGAKDGHVLAFGTGSSAAAGSTPPARARITTGDPGPDREG